MKELTVNELYTLDETIAKDLFEGVTYPWEVLPKISAFILELGATLSEEEYEKYGENVWVAKSATVAPTAYINGPAIIGKNAEVRHCAFIRGNAIVGEGAVVGNSTELKNVVLFNKVQVPHYNYVGDSILGYKSHMGAGSITSNVKSDKKLVVVKTEEENEMLLKEAEKQGFHWYSKGNCKPLPGQHFPDILKFCNNKDVVHSVRIGVECDAFYEASDKYLSIVFSERICSGRKYLQKTG